MKELKLTDIALNYGEKVLFDGIDFSIKTGEKVGLIGINGTGKTTFLNIVAGRLSPDRGHRDTPKDYEIAYLTQHSDFDEDWTVLETVYEGDNPIMNAVRTYEKVLAEMGQKPTDEALMRQFTKAEEVMNTTGAWTASSQAKSILTNLGITDMTQKMGDLSGGQVRRTMLAQTLIQSPDLLILDEPTNHLDYPMIDWLATYLEDYKGALLLVTHDRYFLDETVNQIVELDGGNLYKYAGNYQDYVRQRAERDDLEAGKAHKQKQLYKQELAWMREGVRARGTKQEARKQRFKDLEKEVKNQSTEGEISASFQTQRLGKKVLELEDAHLTLGDQVILDGLDLLIQNQERLGVTGVNGSGKTSFLNVLAGRIPLDSGTLDVGETVKIGYYTQTNEGMDESLRVLTYLQRTAETVRTADGDQISVAQLLERFLFPRSMHGSEISRLSGGEKRRLYLLNVLMQEPNVLLLDEPTNDLDIQTLTILEDYIRDFEGAVIAISHDRYFLDKMAKRLLVFEGQGQQSLYYGSMSDLLEDQKEEGRQMRQKTKPEAPVEDTSAPKEKTRLNYKEQQEWKTIEDELFALDDRLQAIQDEMAEHGSDLGKLQDLYKEQEALEEELNAKMERWEYLSQYVD